MIRERRKKIDDFNSLFDDWEYLVEMRSDGKYVLLDGDFTSEQLRLIAEAMDKDEVL